MSESCPNCGYCPHCQRPAPYRVYPWVQPYPMTTTPHWPPYPYATTSTTSAGNTSISPNAGNTC